MYHWDSNNNYNSLLIVITDSIVRLTIGLEQVTLIMEPLSTPVKKDGTSILVILGIVPVVADYIQHLSLESIRLKYFRILHSPHSLVYF